MKEFFNENYGHFIYIASIILIGIGFTQITRILINRYLKKSVILC